MCLTKRLMALFTFSHQAEIMQSYPIPGSRYVGGYIGVGLEKHETEILLHSALALICPPPGDGPPIQPRATSQTGHKLDDLRTL